MRLTPRKDRWIPACAGMTAKKAGGLFLPSSHTPHTFL
jgi:hypothetical protein